MAAVAVLAATLTIAVGFGGVASAAVRATVQIASVLALGLLFVAMMLRGRFTVLKSPLWLAPIAAIAIVTAQLSMPPAGGSLTTPGSAFRFESPSASWNRHATQQWLLWAGAGAAVLFAAAQTIRTLPRLRTIALSVGAALVVGGLAGASQSGTSNRDLFGVWAGKDRRASDWSRDWAGTESAIGYAGGWESADATDYVYKSSLARETEKPASAPIWYSPPADPKRRFGSFINPETWAACALGLAPLLAALGLIGLRSMTRFSLRECTDGDAGVGLGMTIAAAILTATAAAFASAYVVVPTVVAGSLALLMLTDPSHRRSAFKFGALMTVIAVGVGAASIWRRGGVEIAFAELKGAWSDNASLAAIFSDHFWLGCGLGALPDVWSMYRGVPMEVPQRGSGLLAIAAQIGVIGCGLLALTAAYVTVRWFNVAGKLDRDVRFAAAGTLAGLCSWAAFAVLGPGPDGPVVILVVAALLGCAMRALANAFPNTTRGVLA
jgi:hypothetical protein